MINVSCGLFLLPFTRSIGRINQRVHHYQPYKDEFNFDGIEFPVTIDKTEKFECQNNISVNVFGFEDVLFPLHITKQRFDTHVNLLLYSEIQHDIIA